jgi:hypothetical protein
MYNYRFYSYITLLLNNDKKNKTAVLYNALKNIEPALEDQVNHIRNNKQWILTNRQNFLLCSTSGIYCLFDDDKLLCAGIIEHVQMKRVITLPLFRLQGHARRLLTEFASQMYRCGLFAYTPADAFTHPALDRMGWIRNAGRNEDGTHDYVPPDHVERYKDYYVNIHLDLTKCLRHFEEIGVKC